MKVGGVFLGYGILGLFLFMFGQIGETTNPFISIFIYGGDWTTFLTLSGIISGVTGLGGAVISAYGLVTKNRYMLLGGFITAVIFNYITIISPIKDMFPAPFGNIVYTILSFFLVWTGFEFWGGVE